MIAVERAQNMVSPQDMSDQDSEDMSEHYFDSRITTAEKMPDPMSDYHKIRESVRVNLSRATSFSDLPGRITKENHQ